MNPFTDLIPDMMFEIVSRIPDSDYKSWLFTCKAHAAGICRKRVRACTNQLATMINKCPGVIWPWYNIASNPGIPKSFLLRHLDSWKNRYDVPFNPNITPDFWAEHGMFKDNANFKDYNTRWQERFGDNPVLTNANYGRVFINPNYIIDKATIMQEIQGFSDAVYYALANSLKISIEDIFNDNEFVKLRDHVETRKDLSPMHAEKYNLKLDSSYLDNFEFCRFNKKLIKVKWNDNSLKCTEVIREIKQLLNIDGNFVHKKIKLKDSDNVDRISRLHKTMKLCSSHSELQWQDVVENIKYWNIDCLSTNAFAPVESGWRTFSY